MTPSARTLLPPAAFFLCALAVAGYLLHYRPLEEYNLLLFKYVNTLQLENRDHRLRGKRDHAVETGTDIPRLLSRINQAGEDNGVAYRKLVPDAKAVERFTLELVCDFPTLLHLASDLEALGLVLEKVRMQPVDKDNQLLEVAFSLRPHGSALELERLNQLKDRVRESGHRNPFQRAVLEEATVLTDISGAYKLSGTGVDNAGLAIATINQKNHHLGDEINGMTVSDIQKGKVYLEKRGNQGVERFLLQFRTRKGAE